MRRTLLAVALAVAAPSAAQDGEPFAPKLQTSIERHLGRPYVWGASGIKSFDCSGFVWRVYSDAGLFLKRTTARKLWFSLGAPSAGREHAFGNLLFFDDLKHVGIVRDRDTFYHAAKSTGTAHTRLDPYWRKLYGGIRVNPATQ